MTAASTTKLVVINSALALKVPPDARKLLRIERYLGRQARAAHNLGVPDLERVYNIAFLSLRTWRIATFEQHPERKEVAPWTG
jgi:hypothetical protein